MFTLFMGLCLGLAFGFINSKAGLQSNADSERAVHPVALSEYKRLQSVPELSLESRIEPSSSRILCWVPSVNASGVIPQFTLNTWGRHCNKLVWIVHRSQINKSLWVIIQSHWAFVAEEYLNDYDWFVKVDDDGFFVPENFRYLVRNMDPSKPHYFGHTCHHGPSEKEILTIFNLGGSYAVSRAALSAVYPFLPDSKVSSSNKKCRRSTSWAEDVLFADCLKHAGIEPDKSVDEWGRQSFMGIAADVIFLMVRRPDSSSWWWQAQPSYIRSGSNCCSARPINWHSSHDYSTFYFLEWSLYRVFVDPIPIQWKRE